MRYYLTVFLWCSAIWSLPAQIQKTVHQSFDFPDTVRVISFHLAGDYVVETWPGNVVMSETRINLYNGSRGMLEYMLKNKRYELEGGVGRDSLTIRSVVMERPDIRTSDGQQVTELLDIRIFIPKNFVEEKEGYWRRQDDEQPEKQEKENQTAQGIEEGKVKHEERD